jgi:hypothetical protein
VNRLKLIIILGVWGVSQGYSQMNFQDSSAQVISYWNIGEKYEYAVEYQKLKIKDQDTTSNETITYEVEVSVIDSTSNGYTVRWFYKNYETNSENPIVKKLVSASENIGIDIQLDELGTILGVANWEEVRDYMSRAFDTLVADVPDIPELNKMIANMKSLYATKESIEATAIQDAQQFHNFHGGKFTLNEKVTGVLPSPNLYNPEKPFDTEVSVVLEDLDQENNEFRIRSINIVDSEQLTETTYQYVTKMFKDLNQEIIPREEFQNLTNTIETVSRIHNTGWLLESILWKEVMSDGRTNLEIRTIVMK